MDEIKTPGTQGPFSRETLEFLDWMLGTVTLSAQMPDLENQARIVAKARREVQAALGTET